MASVDGGAPVEIVRPLDARASACSASPSTAASAPSRSTAQGRGWQLTTRGATHKVQVLDPHVAELSVHMIEKAPPDLSRLLLRRCRGC